MRFEDLLELITKAIYVATMPLAYLCSSQLGCHLRCPMGGQWTPGVKNAGVACMQCQMAVWNSHKPLCKTLRNFVAAEENPTHRSQASTQFFREVLQVLPPVYVLLHRVVHVSTLARCS